jgi:uncharacterized protein (TIGR03000 family)
VIYGGSCFGCCGGCYGGVVTSVAPPSGEREKMQKEIRDLKEEVRKLKGGKAGASEVSEPAPGHVVVNLPEDARLTVDDVACPLTSARRAFNTPDLQPGRTYFYVLKVEAMRDGQTVTQSKRVTVRAGEETTVEFGELRASRQTAQR